jgi:regulator of RNase E activity RraB
MIDMGYTEEEQAKYPQLMLAEVRIAKSTEHPFGSDEDVNALREAFDAALPALGSQCVHLADVRHDTSLHIWFGVKKNADPRDAITKLCGSRPVRITLKHDPDWLGLDELSPSQAESQATRNARILEALEAEGDQLSVARPVEHAFLVEDDETCDQIAAVLAKHGFEEIGREEEDDDASGDELKFTLRFARTHDLERNTIDELTIELANLAEAANAFYDGWGTEIVR